MLYNKTYKEVASSRKELKELATLYQETFSERLDVSCGSCIKKGIERLNTMAKKETVKKEVKKVTPKKVSNDFKLSVAYIREFGSGNTYTNENLTPKVAIAYLKKNENRKSQFSKLPKNIDELLK